jgi:hypothetical protein
MTPEVYAEWKEHQSRLAFIWQRTMVAKKRIVFLNISPHVELRNQVANTPADSKNREAMIKDIHLIEAALATDRTVISLDDTARKLFSTASVVVRELRRVVWVNPAKTSEEAVSWVKNGAKPERQRQLSFRIEEKQ